jgi:hypothetical protein
MAFNLGEGGVYVCEMGWGVCAGIGGGEGGNMVAAYGAIGTEERKGRKECIYEKELC